MEARLQALERALEKKSCPEVIDVDAQFDSIAQVYQAIKELRQETENGWTKLAGSLEQVIQVHNATEKGLHKRDRQLTQLENIIVSIFIFNPFSTIFITQLTPLSLLSPYVSLCFPISPYVISMILMFFPTLQTPTLLSLSPSSQPFTRYQEQDLLVVNFGLLRAISTISTISTISLPPPKLLYDLSQGSLQPHEYLTSYLEIANSLLQHLNLRSYW